jgi:dTMP kinase
VTWRYLAVEGVDGAGKSTVAAAVAAALEERGERVLLVREPGGTPTGEAIRQILLHSDESVADWTEAMLFAASRAQLAAEVVGPALAGGARVVSDRTVYSSLAYQGGGRGLGIGRVREVNEAGLQGIWPDRVLLLRVDPAAGLEREDGADRISVQGVDLQQRVAEAYDRLAEEDPDRFVVVDASAAIDRVVAEALERLVGT